MMLSAFALTWNLLGVNMKKPITYKEKKKKKTGMITTWTETMQDSRLTEIQS